MVYFFAIYSVIVTVLAVSAVFKAINLKVDNEDLQDTIKWKDIELEAFKKYRPEPVHVSGLADWVTNELVDSKVKKKPKSRKAKAKAPK